MNAKMKLRSAKQQFQLASTKKESVSAAASISSYNLTTILAKVLVFNTKS